jgi:hypothetical protein
MLERDFGDHVRRGELVVNKDDLQRIALSLAGVEEKSPGSYEFSRDGRMMLAPYLEKVHPKKARVKRYDMFVVRVADADDKEALLAGDPDVFFTTDHYNGYATVIVRLDAVDEVWLAEIVDDAWAAAPLSTKLKRAV